jgi:hypothetical protein
MGGHRKAVLVAHRAFIMERLRQTPHLTLHALKDELAARGVKISHNAIWLFLRREGLRFKKTLFAVEQARKDVARRRRRSQSWQASLDTRRLVSSTRLGSRPAWPRCADGGQRAPGFGALRRTATGAR